MTVAPMTVARSVMQHITKFLDHEITGNESPEEIVEKMEENALSTAETSGSASDALAPILDPLIFFLLQQQIGNRVIPNVEKLEEKKPSIAVTKKFEAKSTKQKFSNNAKNIRMHDHKSAGRRRC
eukprot:CAMPEP_0197290548 /NCGR_PEP_ID=MMETSP0890-20130614/7738_1 /TAXON_ID=44058 ORGANISM="Aureoumbra lagunensis, Strain CCMP1510" /NCGR_SAMPLE_ID=MMETSP0890 /ASSEMBLY_ACC=CAM_ASM_000533 /LENGTH=124 /DNA_ID=CAMNT_0042762579 /DNA_START=92 /DNA_END=466 /DNA_ORIENTATION=+